MSKNKNLIAVTMGDPSGISTEITIKAWIKKNTNPRFFLIHDPVYVSRVIKKMKVGLKVQIINNPSDCLLYTSPSPRDQRGSRMPSSA